METTVTVKGQIVIPAPLRRKYGIKKGTRISIHEHDGQIVLEPINLQSLRRLRGLLNGTHALEELMAERARDREKEDAELFPRSR